MQQLGVDIELWAHEHEYQRMWPVYNRTVYNGSDSEPYVDPKAPVHFITGSAVSLTKRYILYSLKYFEGEKFILEIFRPPYTGA